SADGGTSFTISERGLHVDTHAINVAPSNSSVIYHGNDGGIFKSTDAGVSWSSLNNSQFSATQTQYIATHPTDREVMISGNQDNGTILRRADASWFRVDFGEGGLALTDQNTNNTTNVTMYNTYFNVLDADPNQSLLGLARVTKTACASDDGNTSQWVFRGFDGGNPTIGCDGVPLG